MENLDVDGSIILNLTFKKYDGAVDWMDLVKERNKLRAVLNAVMNLRSSKRCMEIDLLRNHYLLKDSALWTETGKTVI